MLYWTKIYISRATKYAEKPCQTSHFDAARPLSDDRHRKSTESRRSIQAGFKTFQNAVRNVRRMSNTVKNIKDKNKQVPESNITSEGHSGTGNQNTVNDDDESIIGSLQDQDVVSIVLVDAHMRRR